MYGLPQACRLANKLLVKLLAPHGCHPVRYIYGMWKHHTHPVAFTLVVDDFCIKYVDKENADHLINTLKQDCEVTEDSTG
jgi:hypothetical protein